MRWVRLCLNNLHLSRQALIFTRSTFRVDYKELARFLNSLLFTIKFILIGRKYSSPKNLMLFIDPRVGGLLARSGNLVRVNLMANQCSMIKYNSSFDPDWQKKTKMITQAKKPNFVEPTKLAKFAKSKLGYYPIFFSSLDPYLGPKQKKRLISSQIPGIQQHFIRELDYLAEYQESIFAFSFKKSGWETNRLLEIIKSGSIPLIPDINRAPTFSLLSTPKKLLENVYKNFRKLNESEFLEVQSQLRDHYEKFMTTKYLANYLQELALGGKKKIVFFDLSLRDTPDYLSIMVLHALEKFAEVFVIDHVPYLYPERLAPIGNLYGNGFGYQGRFSKRSHSILDLMGTNLADRINSGEFDQIVVGNWSRNREKFTHLGKIEKERVSIVFGEDQPPTTKDISDMLAYGKSVFVREGDYFLSVL